jgi:Putative inner membrane protein (DUF1819)
MYNVILNKNYSIKENYISCTNNAFAFRETVLVAGLLEREKTWQEIQDEIRIHNLFQLRSLTSREKAFRAIHRLLRGIDRNYIQLLANPNSEVRTYTYLFLLLTKYRLLRELVTEILIEKIRNFESRITETDIRFFFEAKKEQVLEISRWSESTYKKTISNTTLILMKSDILHPLTLKRQSFQILRSTVPSLVKQRLELDGARKFLLLMLDSAELSNYLING